MTVTLIDTQTTSLLSTDEVRVSHVLRFFNDDGDTPNDPSDDRVRVREHYDIDVAAKRDVVRQVSTAKVDRDGDGEPDTIMTIAIYQLASPLTTLIKMVPIRRAGPSDRNLYLLRLEVDGLEPKRTVTAEESASLGFMSLDPPTLQMTERQTAKRTHRELIRRGERLMSSAITSTTGELATPGQMLMTYWRTTIGIRGALRLLKEEI